MKTLSRLLLSGLLVLLIFTLCSAASATHPQQRIDRQELIKLFKEGKPISNRIIQADDILEIFRSAYRDAKLNGLVKRCGGPPENPKSEEDEGQGFPELRIEGSIIKGQLDTNSLRVPDCELPEAVYRHFQDVDFLHGDPRGTASIIPTTIYIKDSSFQEPVRLTNTVFLSWVTFDKVSFHGITDFTGAYFERGARFEDLTLGTEDREGTNVLFFATYFDSVYFEKVIFNGNAEFPVLSSRYAEFNDTTFEGLAYFERASFSKHLSIERVTFKDEAIFSQTSFPEAKGEEETSFLDVNFQADAKFTKAKIPTHLFFLNTNFQKDVFFNDLNRDAALNLQVGGLTFEGVRFSGRAYFDNSKLDNLFFFSNSTLDRPQRDPSSQNSRSDSPISFDKVAVFNNLDCHIADFTEAEFHDFADFRHAKFHQAVSFNDTIFLGEVNFNGAEFPKLSPAQPSGIGLDGTRFQQPIRLAWEQIDDKVRTDSTETWGDLQDEFKRSGNLRGQNEAMYHQEFQVGAQATGFARFSNMFDRLYWGYGVRPLRLIGWMTLIYCMFAVVYWNNIDIRDGWRRLKYALIFSLRTSWKFGYGYEHARKTNLKVLTIIQSVGFKIMLLCLLNVLSNTSPLLNELLGKLLPR